MSKTAIEVALQMVEGMGVSLDAFYSDGRHRKVVHAREMFCHVLRTNTQMSYPEISRAMGRIGHTGALHACRRALESPDRKAFDRYAAIHKEELDFQRNRQLSGKRKRERPKLKVRWYAGPYTEVFQRKEDER